jgi:hypothetical protein
MRIHINFHELMSIYEAKNYKKFKQLVYTIDFNASELSIIQN